MRQPWKNNVTSLMNPFNFLSVPIVENKTHID